MTRSPKEKISIPQIVDASLRSHADKLWASVAANAALLARLQDAAAKRPPPTKAPTP